ncbi:hypothetical protein Slin15195_G117550 [Septoria linicola]|uniref:Uncharacterized protein n=1 Tax=Septoria linicola TaxID=215465 RepID=A0A9Q9B8R4_9PEZI|nr:hypothetical protein Slin15195_G117550 [Septoria linicola]
MPNRITTQFPPSPSSAASETDSVEMVFTPNSSRASSVSRPYHGSRRTSRADNRVTKRNRRQSPGPVAAKHDKKAKKTEKEKLNRGNQAAVMTRMEDALQHYCRWERIEQSGGNGNSAGLTSCKINVLRASEATELFLLHEARCAAIRSGTLADFERRWQQVAEDSLKPEYRPGDGTFLQLPPGEEPCRHEDTKSKECSAHGHSDWRDCRKSRMETLFRRNEDAYIAKLGMTRQQAMYGTRAAPMQARPNVLPHRQSRH